MPPLPTDMTGGKVAVVEKTSPVEMQPQAKAQEGKWRSRRRGNGPGKGRVHTAPRRGRRPQGPGQLLEAQDRVVQAKVKVNDSVDESIWTNEAPQNNIASSNSFTFS